MKDISSTSWATRDLKSRSLSQSPGDDDDDDDADADADGDRNSKDCYHISFMLFAC